MRSDNLLRLHSESWAMALMLMGELIRGLIVQTALNSPISASTTAHSASCGSAPPATAFS